MRPYHEVLRDWLIALLKRAGRGAKSKLAAHMGVRLEVITRLTNKTPGKETRNMSAEELQKIRDFFGVEPPLAKPAIRSAPKHQPRTNGDSHTMPVVSWVSAGKLAEPEEPTRGNDSRTISAPDLEPGDYFALTVRGDSMDRVSPENSVIIVNRRQRELLPGRAYIFAVRGEATYKIYRPDPPRLEPFSTNPSHNPIFVTKKVKPLVVGRVRRTILDL